MKPLLVCVLFLSLFGCIDPMEGLAYRTPLGVGMFDEGLPGYLTPEQLDEQAEAVMAGLEKVGYSRHVMLGCLAAPSHPNMWVVPKPFRCNDWTSQECNGSQQASILIIAAKACRYNTALMHEFGHYFQMCADGGTYDPNHEQTWVWEVADFVIRECTNAELYPVESEEIGADIKNIDMKFFGGVQ